MPLRYSAHSTAFVALFLTALSPLPTAFAQTTSTPPTEKPFAERIAAIEQAVEKQRTTLGVPGASLVIVQDDKVVFVRGFGWRDVAAKKPVTPDTLFAIGSSTKAFTAMSVLMAQEDGKLSLTDPPRKYLPYFKLKDSEADTKITLRDLLCHNSGLPRTDIAWIGNKLNREEAIRVLGDVTPMAKFGEKFQYQNILFAAAGEIAAKAERMPYEKLIETRILKPLGMTATTLSVSGMQKAPDFAAGYDLDPKNPGSMRLPMRDIPALAPAGAINSNATDMAKWLRLMLGNGVYEGKRLVSEASMTELMTKRTPIGGTMSYALGWFVRDWHGHKVVEHGGNIDGFNAEVALMPDQKLGFVLLTNVSASPMGESVMQAVWSNLLPLPPAENPAVAASTGGETDPKTELGSYSAPGVTAQVSLKEGKLFLAVPGQPAYPLERLSGRRYKLGTPAPDGFFVTFRPVKDKPDQAEAFLEQPQGNLALVRVPAASGDEKKALLELVAEYELEKGQGPSMAIVEKGDDIVMNVPGQPPYPLKVREKDLLVSPGLPDGYAVAIRRDSAGKVMGLTLKQPNGEFPLRRKAGTGAYTAPLSADALIEKMIVATGGEPILRRHVSLETRGKIALPNQGLTGTVHSWAKAPDREASETVLIALGKKEVGRLFSGFDGTASISHVDFVPDRAPKSENVAMTRRRSQFHPLLELKKLYKSVAITGQESVEGQDCYVLQLTPESGQPVTQYVNTKTFLLQRMDGWTPPPSGEGSSTPLREIYSDWHDIDGEKVAFQTVTKDLTLGDIVTTLTQARFNVSIDDARFRLPSANKASR